MITLFLGNELLIKLSRSSISSEVVEKPKKAYVNSAGYDLIEVLPDSRAVISTGLQMQIPKGYYGQISPQSGLALKNGIVAFNGTVDSGYLGVVYVLLFNFSSEDFLVEKGNRIAQMIFKKCENVSFSFGNLLFDSERGAKGFGSSGL